MKIDLKLEAEIPEGVSCEVQDGIVRASGKLGQLEESFVMHGKKINLKRADNKVIVESKKATKREKKMAGTIRSRIQNMIKGVNEGFVYKLQICYSHFPMKVEVDDAKRLVVIKNFLGERIPRQAKILEGVKVKVEGDILVVESPNKESVGQTAANIEFATKKKGKGLDLRVVQDGIYLIEKDGVSIS